jgi:drug/metabolite transporter (DMT)-like permease
MRLFQITMSPTEFVLLAVSVLTSSSGQFFLKAGALKLGAGSRPGLLGAVGTAITTPELIAGLACYGLGSVAYILLLSRVSLSVAAPAIALVYVISVMLGYFVFHEPLPLSRLGGLGLIVAGVILVLWQR